MSILTVCKPILSETPNKPMIAKVSTRLEFTKNVLTLI